MAGKPEMARLLMLRSKAAVLLEERIDKPQSIVPARHVTGWTRLADARLADDQH
jgi:hypothetical protein